MCWGQSQTTQSLPLAAERVAISTEWLRSQANLSLSTSRPRGSQQRHGPPAEPRSNAGSGEAWQPGISHVGYFRTDSRDLNGRRKRPMSLTHEDPPAAVRQPQWLHPQEEPEWSLVTCCFYWIVTTINIKSFHRRGDPMVNKHEKTISLTAGKHFKLKQQNIFN